MEFLGKLFATTRYYSWIARILSDGVCERVAAFLGSQLLIVSVIVNTYYIGGIDLSIVTTRQTYKLNWDFVVLSTIIYCMYQACDFLARRKESARKEW